MVKRNKLSVLFFLFMPSILQISVPQLEIQLGPLQWEIDLQSIRNINMKMQAADQLHDGLLAPGWRIGSRVASGRGEGKCPLLLGVLQHQLQPCPDPLPNHFSRAFASTPSHVLTDV